MYAILYDNNANVYTCLYNEYLGMSQNNFLLRISFGFDMCIVLQFFIIIVL